MVTRYLSGRCRSVMLVVIELRACTSRLYSTHDDVFRGLLFAKVFVRL